MGIEATLICVDNSEYSRNGDFPPSRLAAQVDAIGLIASAKLSEHFENLVGIVCLAAHGSRLIAAPSNDLGTFLAGLQMVKPYGESEFLKGLQTAQLALKHRLNKSQQQRIICFVASPIKENSALCTSVGKLLKKNNVILDIINMCNDIETERKLILLHEAVNNNDMSHYLNCKPGSDMLLSEIILNSAIMQGGSDSNSSVRYSSNLNELDVDPELDPQLYMALRMSLEQEEERRQRESTPALPEDSNTETTLTMADVENEIKDMAGLEVVPLPRVMEMLMTCEGNSELLESLIYSLPEVDMEDERLKELLDKLKVLLPRLQLQ